MLSLTAVERMPWLPAGMLVSSCLQPGHAHFPAGSAAPLPKGACQEWQARLDVATCQEASKDEPGLPPQTSTCHSCFMSVAKRQCTVMRAQSAQQTWWASPGQALHTSGLLPATSHPLVA